MTTLAEHIRFFRRKVPVPTERWDSIWREAHDTSFTVAGAMALDLLSDLRDSVDQAITDGEAFGTFQKRFDEIVQSHGWTFKGNKGHRARVILQTNLNNAYAAGRYRQLKSPAMVSRRPYWQYFRKGAVLEPRDEHVQWEGLILRHDDKWWNLHYPPSGFGCRHSVRALSPRNLQQMGATVNTAPPVRFVRHVTSNGQVLRVPEGVTPGFDFIPGREPMPTRLQRILALKAFRQPRQLARDFLAFLRSVRRQPRQPSPDPAG